MGIRIPGATVTDVAPSTPFCGLYAPILRALLATVDDDSLRVFLALLARSDEAGVCFPGIRDLMALTGLPQRAVEGGLACLEAMGWMQYLRRDERDAVTRKFLPNVYALHPHIVHCVSPVQNWQSLYFDHGQTRIISTTIKHNQKHNQQEQPQTPPPSTFPDQGVSTKNDSRSPLDYANTGEPPDKPVRNTRAARATSGANAPTPPPHSPPASPAEWQPAPPRRRAAPPPPDTLAAFNIPLGDDDSEACANEMFALVDEKTSINWCRFYVERYGRMKVRAALELMLKQTDLRNPPGWLVSTLERGATDGQAALNAPARGGNRYTSGRFGSFVETDFEQKGEPF